MAKLFKVMRQRWKLTLGLLFGLFFFSNLADELADASCFLAIVPIAKSRLRQRQRRRCRRTVLWRGHGLGR